MQNVCMRSNPNLKKPGAQTGDLVNPQRGIAGNRPFGGLESCSTYIWFHGRQCLETLSSVNHLERNLNSFSRLNHGDIIQRVQNQNTNY